jgi:hypothetical protein
MRKMLNSILVTSVALIILIPLLSIIPLGLTKVGKGILVVLSFLLAIIGLVANTMFYAWQTSAILLLLAFLFTYLLMKRFSSNLFVEYLNVEQSMDLFANDHVNKMVQSWEDGQVYPVDVTAIYMKVDGDEKIIEKLSNQIGMEENLQASHSENEKQIEAFSNRFEKLEENKNDKDFINIDDVQLESFFKNRLALFQDIEVDDNQKDIQEKNNDDQFDSTQIRLAEDTGHDDDYLIQEINFDRNRMNNGK